MRCLFGYNKALKAFAPGQIVSTTGHVVPVYATKPGLELRGKALTFLILWRAWQTCLFIDGNLSRLAPRATTKLNSEISNLFEDPSSLIFRPDFVRRNSAEDAANFVRLTVTDQVKKLSPVPQLLKSL